MLPKLKKTDFKLLSYLLDKLSTNVDFEDRSPYDSDDISRDIVTYGGTATLKKIKLEMGEDNDVVQLSDLTNFYKSMFDAVSQTKSKETDSSDTSLVKVEYSDKFVKLCYRGQIPSTDLLHLDITSISKSESVGTIRDIDTENKTLTIQLYENENIFMQLITEIDDYSLSDNYYIHFVNSIPTIKVLY